MQIFFKLNILSLLLLLSLQTKAQEIVFSEVSLKTALNLAQEREKQIFVDTYAPWCGPCKKLNFVFKDRQVARFFNDNFVNIKVNMDGPNGPQYRTRYRIAFLPTMLILDKLGNVRFKIDRVVEPKELLNIADIAINGSPMVSSPPPPPVKTTPVVPAEVPVKKEVKSEPEVIAEAKKEVVPVRKEPAFVDPNPDEKILYVLDPNADGLPPEILYEESYFRMQLNDGSYLTTARKYLETQEDWSIEKNLRFIYDFLYDTNSPEFDYFLINKDKFISFIGEEQVKQTLEILVNNRLYQGFPRPDLAESISLCSHLDSENGERNAHYYFLDRLYESGKTEEFVSMAPNYIETLNPSDTLMKLKYLEQIVASSEDKKDSKQCLRELEQLKGHENNFHYQAALGYAYLIINEKEASLTAAKKAEEIASKNNLDNSRILNLIERINAL